MNTFTRFLLVYPLSLCCKCCVVLCLRTYLQNSVLSLVSELCSVYMRRYNRLSHGWQYLSASVKQASLFAKNIMTILIQDANKAMAGYQKEILPSSWSPIVKYSVYNIQWRRQLVGTWARAPLALRIFFVIRLNKLSGLVWYYAKLLT